MNEPESIGASPGYADAILDRFGFRIVECVREPERALSRGWGGLLSGELRARWRQREWTVDCQGFATQQLNTLVGLVAALESEGFIVLEAEQRVSPHHAPMVSYRHGLVGVENGMLDSTLRLRMIEFRRDGWSA